MNVSFNLIWCFKSRLPKSNSFIMKIESFMISISLPGSWYHLTRVFIRKIHYRKHFYLQINKNIVVIYFASAYSVKKGTWFTILSILFILGTNHPFISHNLLSYFAIALKLSAFLRHYFPFPILTLPPFLSTSFSKSFLSPHLTCRCKLSILFPPLFFLYIF